MELEDKVRKLHQELIQREINRQTLDNPQIDNKEGEISDTDFEVENIEPLKRVDIEQEGFENIDPQEIKNIEENQEVENVNMAQN